MRMRLGLGPVFAYEWLTTSRRWQVYAARSLFVAFLLASLTTVWWANDSEQSRATLQGQAEVGQYFYQAIVSTQLVLLLLAAPAATAGTVCLDKARGTLTHLLVTDLSNAEIVLGKLAARLVPVLGLVASALPALALGTLLGGIDPRALTGAFLLSLGVATFGCTLALVLSVWGTKTQEVLMTTYGILFVWILASPALWLLQWTTGWGTGPNAWTNQSNPFWLAFANSWQVGRVDLWQDLLFLASTWGISAVLTAVAIVRLRTVASRQAGHIPGRGWWFRAERRGRSLFDWMGPRLDPNPVLWREWHRRRPSRWSRVLWGCYAGAAILVSLLMVHLTLWGNRMQGEICTLFNGGQVTLGFLLLSVASASSMTEERVRGSLDLLLTTPMSTRAIVLGKWWGTFRGSLLLSILPGIVTCAVSWRHGNWLGVLLVVGLILSFGAALTSLGLALATWIPRPGRVIALTVTAYVLVTVGWLFFTAVLTVGTNGVLGPGLASASPFMGATFPLLAMQEEHLDWSGYAAWIIVWIIVYLMLAAGLVAATLARFDRSLGRVSTGFAAYPLRREPKPRAERVGILE